MSVVHVSGGLRQLAAALGYQVAAMPTETGATRLRALAERTRRAGIRWNVDTHPNASTVPDLTRGVDSWPVKCEAEWVIESRNPAYLHPRMFVCTRIIDHTGRHAAGTFGRVVAVWGDES